VNGLLRGGLLEEEACGFISFSKTCSRNRNQRGEVLVTGLVWSY
jgi:hypothetical protein